MATTWLEVEESPRNATYLPYQENIVKTTVGNKTYQIILKED